MPHRKILEEHLYLRVLTDRLRVLAEAPGDAISETRWRKLLDYELRALADALDEHFAREEAGGYMRNVMAAHPELAARAADFVEQHRAIRASVDGMVEAIAVGASIKKLRAPITSLLGALAAHESGETEMVQEAVLRDAGGGD